MPIREVCCFQRRTLTNRERSSAEVENVILEDGRTLLHTTRRIVDVSLLESHGTIELTKSSFNDELGQMAG